MVNFTLIPVLLCTFSWISVSVSEFYTVEVQPGEEVTLLCSNFSSIPTNIFWFKLVNGPNITRISSMTSSDGNASVSEGFQDGRFNMTSNTTTLFLNIKPVDLSDSGLYFCGLNQEQDSVNVSLMANLNIREVPTDGFTNVTTVILACSLTVRTMVNFTLIPVLLCTFSWISVSVSEFYTVEVQPGEEVTLLCSNFSNYPMRIFWFKLVNGVNIIPISSMTSSDKNASLSEGFQDGRFNMTSNTTTLFLNIKPVDSSDSGLYLCGLEEQGSVNVSLMATNLKVQVLAEEFINMMTVILAGVTVFLLIGIICLVVKIWTLYTAQHEEVIPQHTEFVGSDSLNYAALSFRPKVKSSRRPAAERELEPHVVYAATR
ncbi:uncharacterized protein LOC125008808 [Mugil cephalus]|uniref:uncharacterized protein LOC125008808 n=1 Tax=Mugil cephalus TaxID=48193 RepID=UPI001FB781D3|nr:uncharacterized protein LOC125008808 [Mugil cephalus]